MGLFGKNRFQVEGKTVLITGGSAGMGKDAAKILARKGANIVIVARTVATLESALEEIKASAKTPETQRFHSISADLTDADESLRIIKEVTEWNNGNAPDIVWATAGASYPHLFIETSIEQLRSQMDVNYWTVAYLAHATLSAWTAPSSKPLPATEDRKRTRHFIATGSVAAFAGFAGYSPYSPAKSALRNLCDTLHAEMQLYNGARLHPNSPTKHNLPIKIHCVMPGSMTSPGYANEELSKHPVTKQIEEGDIVQTPEEAAVAAIKRLEAGDYLISTQILATVMKVGMMGNSPRSGWGVADTLLGGIVNFVWLFMGPDFDRKAFRWGKKNGGTTELKK